MKNERTQTCQVVPAIDVLDGRIVRLRQGDFARSQDFCCDPIVIAAAYAAQGANVLHLVDLSGARDGRSSASFVSVIRRISECTSLLLQVGGGIRSIRDIAALLDAGADRIVLGTVVMTDLELVRSAVLLFGGDRFCVALDVRGDEVFICGWREGSGILIDPAMELVMDLGIMRMLITDISCDGMEAGPNVTLYERMSAKYPLAQITASGGVRDACDIRALRTAGCASAVVGKSLLSGVVRYCDLLRGTSDLAVRVIPCLDVDSGRVVKGTGFRNLRDAGDPVELAIRYCREGADELVFLDISATLECRNAVFDLAERVAASVNIPFTIGGGIRSVDDARRLLGAGADKVAVNSAAVARPALLTELAAELGRANTVCAIDAKRKGDGWIVCVKGGSEETEEDAIAWAREAVMRGAGELLVTSYDRDGTGEGFDTELLARIRECVRVPIIASGGAGTLKDFVAAVREGGVDAVLAASVFHFGTYSIADVKNALRDASCSVRPFPSFPTVS